MSNKITSLFDAFEQSPIGKAIAAEIFTKEDADYIAGIVELNTEPLYEVEFLDLECIELSECSDLLNQ